MAIKNKIVETRLTKLAYRLKEEQEKIDAL